MVASSNSALPQKGCWISPKGKIFPNEKCYDTHESTIEKISEGKLKTLDKALAAGWVRYAYLPYSQGAIFNFHSQGAALVRSLLDKLPTTCSGIALNIEAADGYSYDYKEFRIEELSRAYSYLNSNNIANKVGALTLKTKGPLPQTSGWILPNGTFKTLPYNKIHYEVLKDLNKKLSMTSALAAGWVRYTYHPLANRVVGLEFGYKSLPLVRDIIENHLPYSYEVILDFYEGGKTPKRSYIILSINEKKEALAFLRKLESSKTAARKLKTEEIIKVAKQHNYKVLDVHEGEITPHNGFISPDGRWFIAVELFRHDIFAQLFNCNKNTFIQKYGWVRKSGGENYEVNNENKLIVVYDDLVFCSKSNFIAHIDLRVSKSLYASIARKQAIGMDEEEFKQFILTEANRNSKIGSSRLTPQNSIDVTGWILPNGKFYPVGDKMHWEVGTQLLSIGRKRFLNSKDGPQNIEAFFERVLNKGWVRIVAPDFGHNQRGVYFIETRLAGLTTLREVMPRIVLMNGGEGTLEVGDIWGRFRTKGELLRLMEEFSKPSTKGMAATGSYTNKKADKKIKEIVKWNGLDLGIEYPKGSIRTGVNKKGEHWERKILSPYGRILGINGADGEELDIYLGPNDEASHVYVVKQLKEDGEFDEYKIILNANDEQQAKKIYSSNYPADWEGLGAIYSYPTQLFIDKALCNFKDTYSFKTGSYKDIKLRTFKPTMFRWSLLFVDEDISYCLWFSSNPEIVALKKGAKIDWKNKEEPLGLIHKPQSLPSNFTIGDVIGFLNLKTCELHKRLEPHVAYVAKDYRRKGVGSLMYSLAKKLSGKDFGPSHDRTEQSKALWESIRDEKRES